MSINSRNKGARGELEFFNKMNELLGYDAFQRNLSQTRGGGGDGETDLPVEVEVKRAEKLPYPAAIRQAKEQATKAGKLPVLAHRRNREDWNVMVILTPDEFALLLKQYDDVVDQSILEIINEFKSRMSCLQRQRADEQEQD